MKLNKLLLHAFGPFTDTVIDFASGGGADLHIVYGPNEAGKSSALRAMTDLRFGIPLRSADDFIHASKDMRVGGVFVDDNGASIGLVRRKRRKNALARFDVDAVDALSSEEDGSAFERLLTGGMDRQEFEAMFGLNHARLREGGQRLVQGEGELGTALFEASAGTRGIAAIVTSLEDDAKALFIPRGTRAVINEARRDLDEQRRAWKAAQTRPVDWQELHRAHQKTSAELSDVRERLAVERRRQNELTELRTVAPLLREYDVQLAAWEEVKDAPDLPESAAQQRAQAGQSLARALSDIQSADREEKRCDEALSQLVIEAGLLDHRGAITRLAARVESVQRARVEARQHQSAVDSLAGDVAAAVHRISPLGTTDDLLALAPSTAERAGLVEQLSQVSLLDERLKGYLARREELAASRRLDESEKLDLPDVQARDELQAALLKAQALGDSEAQQGEVARKLTDQQARLARMLLDLGVDSVEALRACRPLLDAQVDASQETLEGIDQAVADLRAEVERLDADSAQQQLRKRQLAAVGEVVTAETLAQARLRRNTGWQYIRQAYIERVLGAETLQRGYDPDRALPEAFEAAQEESDRQADLLRADAARATGFEECSARLDAMAERRRQVEQQLADLDRRREAATDEWMTRLEQSLLPRLDPQALREWQGRRASALEEADRLQALQHEQQTLADIASQANERLGRALGTVGQDPGSDRLSARIEHAARWERKVTALVARHDEREQTRKGRREERDRLDAAIAGTQQDLLDQRAALDAWSGRLLFPPGSPCNTIQARLGEFDALARLQADLEQLRLRYKQSLAEVEDFEAQVVSLADVLGEPAPVLADDLVERLAYRLGQSLDSERRREALASEKARAARSRNDASTEQDRQTATLATLCAAAGVARAELLPAVEQSASRKRQVATALASQRRQLAEASALSEEELRKRLADKDIFTLDAEREACRATIDRLEDELKVATRDEETARRALEAVDASDAAARAREAMESAVARYQGAIRPWARLRLAQVLLQRSLGLFRERAQAPMVSAAATYFSVMTGGRYPRLVVDDADDKPVLLAERDDGARIGLQAMSEGTADQLYLALRLAALALRRESHPQMPLVLDDVLVTSDDQRATQVLRALASFAELGQVLLFTHHRHLVDLARDGLMQGQYAIHHL